MSATPCFKPSFRIELVEDEGVYVLGELESHVLRGRAFLALAPLLDGRTTEEELCQRLQPQHAPAEVLYALALLRQRGFLARGGAEASTPEAAFWEGLGVDSVQARERLRAARLSIVSLGEVDETPLAESLAEQGLCVGPEGGLSVVLTEDYLHPELARLNQARLAEERPWLLVRPTGRQVWLGPLFVPGRTGCWRCLSQRLESHRQVERYLAHRLGKGTVHPPARGTLPSTRRATAGLVATALSRWVAEGTLPSLEGQVLTLDTASLETRTHRLVRRPQCPDCGEAGYMARHQEEAVRLEPAPRAFTADGGHRQRMPEDTLDRLLHHLSPVTGLVTLLTRVSCSDDDARLLYSYSTDFNFALMARNLHGLRHGLRSFSGGKGRTEAQAKASALGESIERYSAVWQGDEARVRATLAELDEAAIPPGRLQGYSARQYARREAHNHTTEFFRWVPEPFDPAWRIDWSPVWSLTHERRRYVPTALCYYGYPFEGTPLFGLADSNGCAAGNTLTEAILQGFLELVERDAVALWWYNRLRRPGVDLTGFAEPYLPEVVAHWRARGRELWALDVTSDLGIPTFAALSRRLDGRTQEVVFGFGAHSDARVALLRAVTEHNQFMSALPREGVQRPPPDPTMSRWLQETRVEQQPWLLPAEGVSARTLEDYPRREHADLRDEVRRCVELARGRGLETLVLDQTRPDTGLAVVKVLVPGLRHFWPRFGPGRLYDVPVELGLLEAPLSEEALNPLPMFL